MSPDEIGIDREIERGRGIGMMSETEIEIDIVGTYMIEALEAVEMIGT